MAGLSDLTQLLRGWSQGDATAAESVVPAIYRTLREIAESLMARERGDHTLEPAALVNEAYLRLTEQRRVEWQNREQFFAIAARLMRRVLLDHAKHRARLKRGGALIRVVLDDRIPAAELMVPEAVALERALEALARVDPRKAAMIELRYFGGLSVDETARALGCSPRTVAKHWQLAKAFLRRELEARG